MRTQFSPRQLSGIKTGDEAMRYVQVKYSTPAHGKNETITYSIPLPADVDGIMINTIRVLSQENLTFVADLMDGPTGPSIYESLDELRFLYDQVNIPYKPSDKTLYIRILNKGDISTKYEIDIRGVEVK
ncbi:hypothetical protein ACK8P5_25595 (plasmid) [Paenibacillus sp. EC2-1]|uniref:hypothetical protein n=1 Tax=Paenibacillus sp. EC2-1 TaxID=3388665 RepID=UPI003BEF445C